MSDLDRLLDNSVKGIPTVDMSIEEYNSLKAKIDGDLDKLDWILKDCEDDWGVMYRKYQELEQQNKELEKIKNTYLNRYIESQENNQKLKLQYETEIKKMKKECRAECKELHNFHEHKIEELEQKIKELSKSKVDFMNGYAERGVKISSLEKEIKELSEQIKELKDS